MLRHDACFSLLDNNFPSVRSKCLATYAVICSVPSNLQYTNHCVAIQSTYILGRYLQCGDHSDPHFSKASRVRLLCACLSNRQLLCFGEFLKALWDLQYTSLRVWPKCLVSFFFSLSTMSFKFYHLRQQRPIRTYGLRSRFGASWFRLWFRCARFGFRSWFACLWFRFWWMRLSGWAFHWRRRMPIIMFT